MSSGILLIGVLLTTYKLVFFVGLFSNPYFLYTILHTYVDYILSTRYYLIVGITVS